MPSLLDRCENWKCSSKATRSERSTLLSSPSDSTELLQNSSWAVDVTVGMADSNVQYVADRAWVTSRRRLLIAIWLFKNAALEDFLFAPNHGVFQQHSRIRTARSTSSSTTVTCMLRQQLPRSAHWSRVFKSNAQYILQMIHLSIYTCWISFTIFIKDKFICHVR